MRRWRGCFGGSEAVGGCGDGSEAILEVVRLS